MTTAKTLTTKSIMQAFAVSHMTVNSWRKGGASKDPLPTVETADRSVLFKPADVKAWAKANKVEIADASALVPGAVSTAKPGPKAKPVVKKSALRTKAVSKPSPKKLAKKIARAMKPLPRPGEAGYKEPVRKAVRSAPLRKADVLREAARGH